MKMGILHLQLIKDAIKYADTKDKECLYTKKYYSDIVKYVRVNLDKLGVDLVEELNYAQCSRMGIPTVKIFTVKRGKVLQNILDEYTSDIVFFATCLVYSSDVYYRIMSIIEPSSINVIRGNIIVKFKKSSITNKEMDKWWNFIVF